MVRSRSMNKLLIAAYIVGATIFASDGSKAQAATYPTKAITMVVPYSAGGSVDLSARLIQSGLNEIFDQPVIVENRTGAGGTIGSAYVAKSKPDGYTLLFTASSHTINPSLYALSFDTTHDFTPISKIASAPQVLVANKNFKYKTLAELLEISPEEAADINYASGGVGTPGHMAGELFKVRSKLTFPHIPYRGGAPAAVDVMSGQLSLLWVSLPAVSSYIESGNLIPLAVSTKERSSSFPDVPSVSEFISDFDVDIWYALLAPAGVPAQVVETLSAAIFQISENPQITSLFEAQGATYIGESPKKLEEDIDHEIRLWADVIQKAGIKVDN